MGVNHLWSILAPVKTHKPLKSLKGQTLAVDLSVWICESATALQGVPVAKPYLRNLFFRVTNLTQMGVGLIFVLDGEPPELKWEEMERRSQARFEGGGGRWGRRRQKKGPAGGGATAGGGVGLEGCKRKKKERKRFKFVLKECAEMLGNLGIPCVQASGEAEAMCALLNEQGLVDACLTEDGDVFLYGARTVYKNFTLNTKDPHIECYSMEEIESRLGLDQSKLIALALLLGCDYTLGVHGIGPKQSLGLMSQLGPDVDVLERFRDWADGKTPTECSEEALPKRCPHCTKCSHVGSGREHRVNGCGMCESDVACLPKSAESPDCSCPWHTATKSRGKPTVERDVMKKACAMPDFPNELVIEEFFSTRDQCPRERPTWKRPQLIRAQKFISSKLEWPEDYTVEKVFPLVTLWDLMAIASGTPFDPMLHLRPTAVVKKRVRQGVACVEIQWQPGIPHSVLEFSTTIERAELFQKAFPELMTAFEEDEASKTKQKRKRAVKSTVKASTEDAASGKHPPASDLDTLASAVAHLTLTPQQSTSKVDTESRFSAEGESSHSNLMDGFQQHCPTPDELMLVTASSNTLDRYPVTSTTMSFQNINVIPLRRKAKQTKVLFSSAKDDLDEEPLPLSERLRLKKVLEKKCVVDLSASLSSSEDKTDDTPWVCASTLSERCHVKEMDSTDNLEEDSLSVANSSSPLYHQVNLSSMIDRFLLMEAQETDSQDYSSSLVWEEDVTDNSPPRELSSAEQLKSKRVLKTDDKTPLPVDASSCFEHLQLKEHKTESLSGSLSVEEETSETAPLPADVPLFSTGYPDNANFSLGFELTKLLSNDESLLQSTSYAQGPAVDPKSQSPDLSPSLFTSGTKYHPNFSLKFDLTNILNEDESCQPANESVVNISKESNNMIQCSGKLPANHSLGISLNSQSGVSSDNKENSANHNLASDNKRYVSHDDRIRTNHSPAKSSISQSGHFSHVEESSPVSLLDRLKRKHGNEKGVLSAVLSMKNVKKVEKKGKGRKALMEIFDDNEYE